MTVKDDSKISFGLAANLSVMFATLATFWFVTQADIEIFLPL